MRIMEELSDRIEEEMDDAEKYIKLALEEKEERPQIAKLYYDLSVAEMGHADNLHRHSVQIIDDYRREKGDPPADMMAVYNYMHKKQMEKAHKIKMWQDSYK